MIGWTSRTMTHRRPMGHWRRHDAVYWGAIHAPVLNWGTRKTPGMGAPTAEEPEWGEISA
jgi:hypothetical protein